MDLNHRPRLYKNPDIGILAIEHSLTAILLDLKSRVQCMVGLGGIEPPTTIL